MTSEDWLAKLLADSRKASSPAVPFQEWIASLVGPGKPYRNLSVLAAELKMKVGPFKRAVVAGTFNYDNLSILAEKTDIPYPRLLRLAGKTRVAELIEAAYGPDREPLTASQREFLKVWEQVPPDERKAYLKLMRRNRPPEAHSAPASQTPLDPPETSRRRRTPRPA